MNRRQSHFRRRRPAGFTLIELMVSVALALLLLIGVNQVFKTTTTTVGTGYATSTLMRQQVSTERVFDHYFGGSTPAAVGASEQPFIIIHNQQRYAYMNRNDLNGDGDGNIATVDLDGDGAEGEAGVNGEMVFPARYGTRSHRIDTLAFFARDVNNPFRRLTGDQTTNSGLVSQEQSTEAFVWFGPLCLPNNDANPNPDVYDTTKSPNDGRYFEPGDANLFVNPNNFVVSDWALGHVAILLKPTPAVDAVAGGLLLSPISKRSTANFTDPQAPTTGSATQWTTNQSRIDIAATSIDDYREKVNALVDDPTYSATGNITPNMVKELDYRFNAKPWINKPAMSSFANSNVYMQVMSRELALTTPIMYRGCSQFIVEFAGDFVTQRNNPAGGGWGTVTAAKPDGVVDFVVDANNIRHTRWYGMPRDVAGPVTTSGPKPNPTGGPDGKISADDGDVVPVRDVALGTVYPFENFLVYGAPAAPVWGGQNVNYLASVSNLPANAEYVCAWGPNQMDPTNTATYMPPKMIRIIVQMTDTQGRIIEGPVNEYVFKIGN